MLLLLVGLTLVVIVLMWVVISLRGKVRTLDLVTIQLEKKYCECFKANRANEVAIENMVKEQAAAAKALERAAKQAKGGE